MVTRLRELVYVWELPVRITHWLVALAIVALSVTGYSIGAPVLRSGVAELVWLRSAHLVAALVLLCSVAWRVLWAFRGNSYARWDAFIPFARPGWWPRARDSVLFYLFLRRKAPPDVGHNALAAGAYLGIYSLLAVEFFTGFALWTMAWGGGWNLAFGWIFWIVPANLVRLVHHLVMWLLLGFVVHHVYSSVLMDNEERSGILSSIVTGYKFVRRR